MRGRSWFGLIEMLLLGRGVLRLGCRKGKWGKTCGVLGWNCVVWEWRSAQGLTEVFDERINNEFVYPSDQMNICMISFNHTLSKPMITSLSQAMSSLHPTCTHFIRRI